MQSTNIRNEREAITTDPAGIKSMIKDCYEQSYTHVFVWITSIKNLSYHNSPNMKYIV
jgi:hypothetical protein